ncbi:S-adenosyl-L-methionine-dependent methyltransferase [Punctularia strigosozonata HHB-11173 SS5]|uniref:S-adenosyl-L-methionine-dependent methyltransferase n=1 Tax=Punctularia strigosozonata (strain HHB-11173) TaxID=741275 RepID=UPI00044168DB|nr:S-adenosyl-L-methionine-dependent methyltransferase [Punctularia strigosozonata HHB-11173 SS5]EIN09777.1 S-adenosyl-L-methionine-dependent methyltransferase [Punctularia strigosozonata HHB-11173 SS5]
MTDRLGQDVAVQDDLLKQGRKRKRDAGEIPYPLDYSRNLIDYDNFDFRFMYKLTGTLTIHEFEEPPKLVLDLGCGSGLWCIKAAQQWPNSHLIGLDMKDIQPKLEELEKTAHADVLRRVKWVHANMLDRLPFAPNHFDMIRFQGIGLGVPEDEWPSILEEIHRILKPGGVLEIIEEDLIFPTGPLPASAVVLDSPQQLQLPTPHRESSGNLSYRTDASTSNNSLGRSSRSQSNASANQGSAVSNGHSTDQLPPYDDRKSSTVGSRRPHPQDHRMLKATWDELLESRFIAPNPLTILPLYLSATFVDIRSFPLLQVPLPPNSNTPHLSLPQSASTSSRDSIAVPGTSRPSAELRPIHPIQESSKSLIQQWAPMMLARTVQIIVECKEVLWEQYERLFADAPRILDEHDQAQTLQEEFELYFSNWRHDMEDRIQPRRLLEQFKWPEPQVGGDPGWRVWRENLPHTEGFERQPGQDICRRMRCFVGWKADNQPPM